MRNAKLISYILISIAGLYVVKKSVIKEPLPESESGVKSVSFNILDQLKTLLTEEKIKLETDSGITLPAVNNQLINDFLNTDGEGGLTASDLDISVSGTGTSGSNVGFGILGFIGNTAISFGNTLTGNMFAHTFNSIRSKMNDTLSKAKAKSMQESELAVRGTQMGSVDPNAPTGIQADFEGINADIGMDGIGSGDSGTAGMGGGGSGLGGMEGGLGAIGGAD